MKMKTNAEQVFAQVKKYSNRKTLVSVFCLFMVMVVAVVSSIPELLIDPTLILTSKFITKLLMSMLIGTTSMLCFIFMSQTNNAESPKSKLYTSRIKFRESAEKILQPQEFKRFKQWVFQIRRPSQTNEQYTLALSKVGLTDERLLNLNMEEIEELKERPLKKGTNEYYSKLTKEQYKVLYDIKTGKYSLKFLSPSDYLSETTKAQGKTSEQILSEQYEKRTFMFAEKLATKILLITAISIFFGSIAWQTSETIGGEGTEVQKWFTIIWDIASKFANAGISAFMGWLSGEKFNDFDSEYLDLKRTIHLEYYSDNEFVAKTDNELAREDYIKYKTEEVRQANIEYANKLGLGENNEETNSLTTL